METENPVVKGAGKYGNYYYTIMTNLSKKTKLINVYADKIEIDNNGTLLIYAKREDSFMLTFAVNNGDWSAIYAASMFDGHPVCSDYWEGVIETPS